MISCISAPSIVATQLEQLGAQPGHKVLEAGAATGYNAALMGKIVSPGGQVWTPDVDQDLVAGASKNLARAGVDNATATLADGAAGLPEHAPYDRIIFTVGAGDVPVKILDQLAPGGRLVLPMRIRGSISRSFAFERDGQTWKTVSCEMATFIPLRKGVCDDRYIPAIASRIPLVRRPKAPALPLQERITHLTGLTVAPAGASHHDLVARACGVLNYAALIASDVGLPALATTDLCWRQHQVFADAGHLNGPIAVMSLMPLVNLSRLLTRDGQGKAAYDLLTRLNHAARQREKTEIDGRTVDLSALTSTENDHRQVCQELWVTLLVDGARALARIGRWTDAAEAMAKHRGIGNRLLDGRQIKIMPLMEQGLDAQARDMIDATQPREPWEAPIGQVLRAHCRPIDIPVPRVGLDRTLSEVAALLTHPDPSTAVFQTRAGLAALELDHNGPYAGPLLEAVAEVARLDAYAAREILHHPAARGALSAERADALSTVITAAGLGGGTLPADYRQSLSKAVTLGETELRRLLRDDKAVPGIPPEELPQPT